MAKKVFCTLPAAVWVVLYFLLIVVCSVYIGVYYPVLSNRNINWYSEAQDCYVREATTTVKNIYFLPNITLAHVYLDVVFEFTKKTGGAFYFGSATVCSRGYFDVDKEAREIAAAKENVEYGCRLQSHKVGANASCLYRERYFTQGRKIIPLRMTEEFNKEYDNIRWLSAGFSLIFVVVCMFCTIGLAFALCVYYRRCDGCLVFRLLGHKKKFKPKFDNYQITFDIVEEQDWSSIQERLAYQSMGIQKLSPQFTQMKQKIDPRLNNPNVKALLAHTAAVDEEYVLWTERPNPFWVLVSKRGKIAGYSILAWALIAGFTLFVILASNDEVKKGDIDTTEERFSFSLFLIALMAPFLLLPLGLLRMVVEAISQSLTSTYYITNKRVMVISYVPFGIVLEWVDSNFMLEINRKKTAQARMRENQRLQRQSTRRKQVKKIQKTLLVKILQCTLLKSLVDSDKRGSVTVRDKTDFSLTLAFITRKRDVKFMLQTCADVAAAEEDAKLQEEKRLKDEEKRKSARSDLSALTSNSAAELLESVELPHIKVEVVETTLSLPAVKLESADHSVDLSTADATS